MRKTAVALCLVMLMMGGAAWASGLAIPEQGAAALGMSAAMTARSEDLSAIFYNPAGLDYVEGVEVYAGITPILPGHKYSPFPKDRLFFKRLDSESQVFLPPQLYAAWRAHSNVVLGLGVYAPFGLGTDWKKDWAGRYTSTYAEIASIYINPTVAVKVTDHVSIGFGASFISSRATIEKKIDTGGMVPGLGTNPNYDSEFSLEGDGTAFGFNVGALIRPAENVQVGVSYRFAYDMDYEGDAKFKHAAALKDRPGGTHPVTGDVMSLSDVMYARMPASQTGSATMSMPSMLNVGALFDLTERLDFSAEVNLVGWSDYEDLTLKFDKKLPSEESVMEKNWENSIVLRGGMSYDVNEKLIARWGMMFDKNPVPDDTFDGQLPDANRYGFSIGAGYDFGKIRLDAGYMLLRFAKREKDNGVGFSVDTTGDGVIDRFDVPTGYPVGNGVYESRAHLISIAASYKF